jgi:hypothetical protein
MFDVVRKHTGEAVRVYGISGTRFLIWEPVGRCWEWHEMDLFYPLGA